MTEVSLPEDIHGDIGDACVEVQPRVICIYYKLLDEPLKDKRSLF